jgi:hypothetical protein
VEDLGMASTWELDGARRGKFVPGSERGRDEQVDFSTLLDNACTGMADERLGAQKGVPFMNALSLRNRIFFAIGASTLAGVTVHCGGRTSGGSEQAADGGDDAHDHATRDARVPAGGSGGLVFNATGGRASGAGGAMGGSGGIRTIRRPFLVGSSLRAAPAVARDDWRESSISAGSMDPSTRDALARAWLDDAREEHASVAAFARFTMLMLSVGAPPELIAKSQRASLDEIVHAKCCFGLAARYGGIAVGPGPLPVHDALAPLSLAQIAALTAEEGCVGETLGVLLALEQLAVAADHQIVRILRRIVTDEARHAELAWAFVSWAVRCGGGEVLAAVDGAARRAIDETRRVPIRDYGVDSRTWHAHGRVTCAEARGASERGIREVVEPALRALGRFERVDSYPPSATTDGHAGDHVEASQNTPPWESPPSTTTPHR